MGFLTLCCPPCLVLGFVKAASRVCALSLLYLSLSISLPTHLPIYIPTYPPIHEWFSASGVGVDCMMIGVDGDLSVKLEPAY